VDRKEVEEKVKNLLIEILGVSRNKINSETRLVEDLGADSLSAVEILYAIKEEFEVDIPQKALARAYKVKDVIDYLMRHIKK